MELYIWPIVFCWHCNILMYLIIKPIIIIHEDEIIFEGQQVWPYRLTVAPGLRLWSVLKHPQLIVYSFAFCKYCHNLKCFIKTISEINLTDFLFCIYMQCRSIATRGSSSLNFNGKWEILNYWGFITFRIHVAKLHFELALSFFPQVWHFNLE